MDRELIRRLNDRLPKTRLVGQGLIRDESGRVLLCELTYKPQWDLPGGVVEADESPRSACLREVREELGVLLRAERLLATNWLPPWGGWDDAMTFLFDLGEHPSGLVGALRLDPHEIRGVHWVAPCDIAPLVPVATARLLAAVLSEPGLPPAPLYLEDGLDGGMAGVAAG